MQFRMLSHEKLSKIYTTDLATGAREPIQNGMPGLAAPDPAFITIVEPRSSFDVPMIEFVRKSLLGSPARDIKIHQWSCILWVSSDGR